MKKTTAILGSAIFFAAAPFVVGFVTPWWIAGWRMAAPYAPFFPVCGCLLVVLGAVPLISSFARFALDGLGTPAPIAPTQHLVVTGFYRYVRNPMYVGVLLIVLGNAAILGDAAVVLYAVFVAAGFSLFVFGYEEPTLQHRYGAEYAEFCAHVPRWVPRLTPWRRATRE